MISFLNKKITNNFCFVSKMNKTMQASIERAQRVQQNVLEQNYKIQMQSKLRKRVDFDTAFHDLQQQLRQQVARSLKKSQQKVIYFIEKAQIKYKQLSGGLNKDKKQKEIKEYNQLIDMCQKARWQFLVHRQSCGFTIKNYQLVHNLYQIPPKLI